LLGFGNHALDFIGGQAAFVVGYGDGFRFAGALVGYDDDLMLEIVFWQEWRHNLLTG